MRAAGWPPVQVNPAVPVAVRVKLTPAGAVSVTWTVDAVDGPLLRATSV